MGFIRCMPSPYYPAIVVLFQLHGGMVSYMWVLATPSSTVHNTIYLDPYHWRHISFSCLFLRQWCRDVASGVDRHLDLSFGLHVVDSLFLVSILYREAFSHPYICFLHLLVKNFSATSFRTFFRKPLTFFIVVGGIGGREWIKMASAKTQSANESTRTSF